MKALIILLIMIPSITRSNCDLVNPQLRVIKAIEQTLKRNSNKKAVPAKELAPVIIRLSELYDVDPMVITRIIMVESKGLAKAYNKRTNDYGLMQLNGRTMKAYGITKQCALTWQCNLEAGIRILADISDGRTCRYNVGSGKLHKQKLVRCLRYERKLASIN